METNFELNKSIEILKRSPSVYRNLFYGLNTDWTNANEGTDTWSAFDMIGHLIHGEKTDWIPRAKIILGDNEDKSFIPFDRFAQAELSEGKTIERLLDEFGMLREQNIQELLSWNLQESDLLKTGLHPELGEVTLQQLIATWTIHDLSHLHQVSRVMVKHYKNDIGPWKQYSGILSGS